MGVAMIGSVLFAIRQSWQADRRGLVQVVAIQLAVAAGTAGALLLLRAFLGDVLSAATRPSAAGVIIGVLTLLAVGSAASVLLIVATARQRTLGTKLDHHLIAMVLDRSSRTELADFEHPHFHDRLQRAVTASRQQPAMVVALLAAALQAALMVAAVTAVFIAMAWWLLPLTVLSALPALKAARDERVARYGLHVALGENRRLREYYERVLSGRDEAKEVRALDL
jgi:ATP-binding cassette, subfamily B, bacterial